MKSVHTLSTAYVNSSFDMKKSCMIRLSTRDALKTRASLSMRSSLITFKLCDAWTREDSPPLLTCPAIVQTTGPSVR